MSIIIVRGLIIKRYTFSITNWDLVCFEFDIVLCAETLVIKLK